MATLGSERSLDDLGLDLNLDVSDNLHDDTTTEESESEDDDVFDEEFPITFYKSNTIDPLQLKHKIDINPGGADENDESLINKAIGKHGPAPPKHSHNIRARSRNRGSSFAHSDTGGSGISITSYSDRSAITPDQWRFIKHKMHELAPILMHAGNNDTHIDIDTPPDLRHQDSDELYIESDNSSNSAHPSDDEVLNDPQLMQNDTLSTILTPTTVPVEPHKKRKAKGHEYMPSMTQSFDPQGYDHVVNALDVLQTFCTSVPGVHPTPQQKNYDMESNHDTDGTNSDQLSDDEVLHRDFDKNHANESEYSQHHERERERGEEEELNNIKESEMTEYEQLRFNIVNSTISHKSRSISNTNGSKQSKKSKKSNPKTRTSNDNDSENKHSAHTHKSAENHAKTSSKHHRRVTPVPLKRPKSKPKKDNITFSEILSLANNRNVVNNNIASTPSSYLMPTNIHNNIHKPLSPSHSVDAQSQTEISQISVDHADEYEYRVMADGGMKRISQSYAIPPVIKSDRVGSREISTVDVILEEHENEYMDNNSNKDNMVGVILKQPSVSQTTTIPIASPVASTPIINSAIDDEIAAGHRIMRTNSLGIPLVEHHAINDRERNASYSSNPKSSNAKEVANKMQQVYSKMESEPEDMQQASSFALTVESPQSGKYNEHNRENSMEVEYDERSAFKEEIYASNYTPKSKSKSTSMLKHRQYSATNKNKHVMHHHKQYKFNAKKARKKKRSKHIQLDLDTYPTKDNKYETHNDEIIMAPLTNQTVTNKMKLPQSMSTDHDMTANARQYTQYAVRGSKSEKQPINVEETLDEDSLNDLEHQQMIVVHDNSGRTDKKAISYLEFSSNKWTKWILLAALSICFILGVFMGFGVSWIFFVSD